MAIESRIALHDPTRVDLTVIEAEDFFTLTQHILPWLRDASRLGYFTWCSRETDDYKLPPRGFDRFDYRFEFSSPATAFEFRLRFA